MAQSMNAIPPGLRPPEPMAIILSRCAQRYKAQSVDFSGAGLAA
jgi:hypothetical protein